MTKPKFSARSLMACVILISACVIPAARAHPSDISYLRVKVERQRVEMRFTFNLLSLTRFVPGIDANQDSRIDKAELEAVAKALNDYFNQHIEVNINEKKATLGQAGPFECVWPVIDGANSVAEADYPVRYVDITYTQAVKPVLADVWLGFDIWQQTGPLGTIEATFEQDDLRMQVPFSMSEPDYLYDTGYAVEAVFQEPAKLADQSQFNWWRLSWVFPVMAVIYLIRALKRYAKA